MASRLREAGPAVVVSRNSDPGKRMPTARRVPEALRRSFSGALRPQLGQLSAHLSGRRCGRGLREVVGDGVGGSDGAGRRLCLMADGLNQRLVTAC
jgi:hypothetical protein